MAVIKVQWLLFSAAVTILFNFSIGSAVSNVIKSKDIGVKCSEVCTGADNGKCLYQCRQCTTKKEFQFINNGLPKRCGWKKSWRCLPVCYGRICYRVCHNVDTMECDAITSVSYKDIVTTTCVNETCFENCPACSEAEKEQCKKTCTCKNSSGIPGEVQAKCRLANTTINCSKYCDGDECHKICHFEEVLECYHGQMDKVNGTARTLEKVVCANKTCLDACNVGEEEACLNNCRCPTSSRFLFTDTNIRENPGRRKCEITEKTVIPQQPEVIKTQQLCRDFCNSVMCHIVCKEVDEPLSCWTIRSTYQPSSGADLVKSYIYIFTYVVVTVLLQLLT